MPDPQAVTARAQAWSAAARQFRSSTLLSVGSASGVTGHLIMPNREGVDRAALNLAHAVAARAEIVDELPDLSGTRRVGVMRADVRAAAGRSPQSGADPAEAARRIEMALRPGPDGGPAWVAATVRRPTKRERRRTLRWFAHRLGSANPVHHSSDTQAVVVTFMAGGDDADDVRQRLNQVAAVMPGFDIDVKVRILRPLLAAVYPFAAALAAGTGLHLAHSPAAYQVGAAALGAALALLTVTGLLPNGDRRLVRRARAAVFDPPPRKFARTASPARAGVDRAGRATDDSPGDYPLARETFMVGPAVLTGLVAPHAGAASGSAVTERRSASAAMLDAGIGPYIGTAGNDNARVHLSAADLSTGFAAIGKPGSGKSQVVRSLFAWNCLERVVPTGVAGSTGARNSLIAFESKGDGALVYRRWARAVGDSTLLIDVADPDSYAIDIFDLPGSVKDRARLFANMLVYAFDAGSIQGQSFESLEITLTGALVVTDDIADSAGVQTGRSPIFYCYVLLGGHGDEKGRALAAAISEAAARAEKDGAPDTGDLIHADDKLAIAYGGKVTESARRNQMQAARNKISDMLAAESWWSPSRRKVTWNRILTEHRSVIVNAGVSTKGHQLDERLARYMTSLLTYSLVETVKRTCSGWQAEGRSVSIFSDELSQMAGSSTETMTWLHDQGRSYGVRAYLATQRLQQLPLDLRSSLMDYSAVLWFAQSSTEAANAAVNDLVADGSEWTTADITGLEPYTAVVRCYVGQVRQPAVPVRLTHFESDMAGFAAAQSDAARPGTYVRVGAR